MISRKIHEKGIIDFENADLTLKTAIASLKQIGVDGLKEQLELDMFECYIVDYFYDGITTNWKAKQE